MQLSLKDIIPTWWSFFWRAVVYSMLLGFVLGFIGGAIAGMVGASEKGVIVGAVLGYLASIPGSMFALKHALSKHLSTLVAHAARA